MKVTNMIYSHALASTCICKQNKGNNIYVCNMHKFQINQCCF